MSSGNSPSAGYCSVADWSSFGNGDAIESAFSVAWLKSGNACFLRAVCAEAAKNDHAFHIFLYNVQCIYRWDRRYFDRSMVTKIGTKI